MTLKNTEMYDIIVSNKQKIDEEYNIIEEKAEGKYFYKADKKCIMYKDAHSQVTVIVGRNEVKLRRRGGVVCDMLFLKGRRTGFLYTLPYGSIPMEIFTNEISDALSENGGVLELVYELDAGGASYNTIKITILKR